MAAPGLSLELVRDFLMNQRCRVEYKQLVLQFKPFLFDAGSRDLFKDIVNTIADVTQEGSTKYIVLKPSFYFSPDQRSSLASSTASGSHEPRRSGSSSSSSDGHGSVSQVSRAPMPGKQISAVQQQPMIGHNNQSHITLQHPPQLPPSRVPQAISGQHHHQHQIPAHHQYPGNQINVQNQQMQRQISTHSVQSNQNMIPMNRQSMSNLSMSHGVPPQHPHHIQQKQHPMHHQSMYSMQSMTGLPQQLSQQQLQQYYQQQQLQQQRMDNGQRAMRTSSVAISNEYQVPVSRPQSMIQTQETRRNPPTSLPLANSFNDGSVTVTAVPYNPSYNDRNPPTGPRNPPPAVPTSPSHNQIQWSPTTPSSLPPQPPPRRRASMSSSISSTSNLGGTNGSTKGFTSPGDVVAAVRTLSESGTQLHQEHQQQKVIPEVTKSPGHLDHQEEKLKEISELAKTPGRVKEHADKWNRLTSVEKTMAFSASTYMGSNQVVNAAQEVASSGSSGNSRPVSRKDDPDTDSGSVQPLDPIRKKWMLAAALCEMEEMAEMLGEDPKLANFKDTTSTALHWAAKFGRLDLIELLAGQYFVNTSMRSGGYTPLHLGYMFGHETICDILINKYRHLFGPSNNHGSNLKAGESTTGLTSGLNQSVQSAFTRIGSLNSRMKKTARAITGIKSWGSQEGTFHDIATNQSNDSNSMTFTSSLMRPPASLRGSLAKKKKERRKNGSFDGQSDFQTMTASGTSLPIVPTFKNYNSNSSNKHRKENDSDEDYGFQ